MGEELLWILIGLALFLGPLVMCLRWVRWDRLGNAWTLLGTVAIACLMLWLITFGSSLWSGLVWVALAMAASVTLAGAVVGTIIGLFVRRARSG